MDLGAYRLISRLGAGGMGEVWRAEDKLLLREVAIKILPARLAADREWKARFLREARTVAQLNHPNIATIHSIHEEGATLFIVMELVEGEPLAALLARGRLPISDTVRIGAAAADALAEAHAKGIIHRDVKPDNIVVSPRVVKVLDFGIAKMLGAPSDEATLTQSGMIIGTPFYMSPEQALGRALDTRTDIFSFGVVLYEALAGRRPFQGDTPTSTLMQLITQAAPPLAQLAPDVPGELTAIVNRCLQKRAEDRFQSASEISAALRAVANLRANIIYPATVVLEAPPAPKAETLRPVAAMPEPPKAPPRPPTTGRALIADDDAVTRKLLAAALEDCGLSIDEVTNGVDAVKSLKQQHYDLLFLDILMPRVDGWGVIDYIRTHQTPKRPRVFIVTGVKEQHLSNADQDVVTGLLTKPLDRQKIVTIARDAAH